MSSDVKSKVEERTEDKEIENAVYEKEVVQSQCAHLLSSSSGIDRRDNEV